MDDDDEYSLVKKRPLKLSGTEKTTKRKTKQPKRVECEELSKPEVIVTTSTRAEEVFKSKQDKIAEERILKKASKTHKQRVEEFNKHLDSLSEHYDIPKEVEVVKLKTKNYPTS